MNCHIIARTIKDRGGRFELTENRQAFTIHGAQPTDEQLEWIKSSTSNRDALLALVKEEERCRRHPVDVEDLRWLVREADFDEDETQSVWRYFDSASCSALQGLLSNPTYLDDHDEGEATADAIKRAVLLTRARFEL